jgi:hypothetical protein
MKDDWIVVNKGLYQWVWIAGAIGWLLSFYLVYEGTETFEQNVVYYDKIQGLEQDKESLSNMATFYQERNIELSTAVEALMSNCTPRDVLRGIKATPLPKLKDA